MKVYEKINLAIRARGWTIAYLSQRIKSIFDENSVHYLTLLRALNGKCHLRESTLFQIAIALDETPFELKKGTEDEEKTILCKFNKKAFLEIENTPLKYLTGKLILLPGGRTETIQDPMEKGKFSKWLYGLRGEMLCVVTVDGNVKKTLIKKNESYYFDSTNPHSFINNSKKKAMCILVQNPKYI